MSTYTVGVEGGPAEEYRDEFKQVHRDVLGLLGMDEEAYWTGKKALKNQAENATSKCGI